MSRFDITDLKWGFVELMVKSFEPDLTKVIHINLYPHETQDLPFDYEYDNALLRSAEHYLENFSWNEGIKEKYIGYILAEKIGIFLFMIDKSRTDVDEWIWVIVGDIPPAYMTVDLCKTPAEALDGYIGAMEEWVDAAKNNKSVNELIPVNVTANPENAQLLETRLTFMDEHILPKIQLIENELGKNLQ